MAFPWAPLIIAIKQKQDRENCKHPMNSRRKDTYTAGFGKPEVKETCLACGKRI